MRVTQHNGRANKKGAYSAKHNDRNFDISKADHIDPERTKNNKTWIWDPESKNFEEAEKKFYEQHFEAYIENQNARDAKYRHKNQDEKRHKTLNKYYTSTDFCPEETLLQVGKADDCIDPETLWQIALEQKKWEERTYPQCVYLDMALHTDEQGAPHVHIRKVWVGHNNHGEEVVGQKKALTEMGVQLPDPSKPDSQRNNRKQTYSAACRQHLIKVCQHEKYNLKDFIETEPLDTKRGLSLIEYQRQQEQNKVTQAITDTRELLQINEDLKRENGILLRQEDIDHAISKAKTKNGKIELPKKDFDELVATRNFWLKTYDEIKEKAFFDEKEQIKQKEAELEQKERDLYAEKTRLQQGFRFDEQIELERLRTERDERNAVYKFNPNAKIVYDQAKKELDAQTQTKSRGISR